MNIEEYYRTYGSMVYRRCMRLLNDEDEAVDAMQEVFVKLLEMRATEVRAPSSLLYVIATRSCLNRIRSRRRRPETPDEELIHGVAHANDSGSRSQARLMLGRLFKHNPETSRVIALLHFLDGLTLQETADEVGMSVSGVRRRIRVMRQQLHELEVVR